MSLDRAIQNGKEKRKPYKGVKAIDKSCRNNRGCSHCLGNRLHGYKKRVQSANTQLEIIEDCGLNRESVHKIET